ncbi:MAG TPA: DUF6438 domain-containing protein, partial [Ferruginibacter sp.]|nr:DUF6438 domain-containing protein [Ferruginibacter sp.]
MKRITLLSLLLLVYQQVGAQHVPTFIDSINSNKEVENLIHSIDRNYSTFKIKDCGHFRHISERQDLCERMADSLGITKSFYRSDLDHNGYTDLLVIGEYSRFCLLVVLNYGNDSFRLNQLTRRHFQECVFPKINNDTTIRYYFEPEPRNLMNVVTSPLIYADLIFKFGDFVELNQHPCACNIEKIDYQTTGCFGMCPIFHLSISGDRSAVLNAEEFNWDEGMKKLKG